MRLIKIKIPEKVLTAWKLARYYGDIAAIQIAYKEEEGMSRTFIADALNGKDSPQKVIDNISTFYKNVGKADTTKAKLNEAV